MIQWGFAGKNEKSSVWYIGAAAVALGLIIWAIITGIYFLVIVVFIFA